jgi:glutamyl-tRNA reductase
VSLVVVGLNHRTVPLELLERAAVSPARLPKALHDLAGREHLVEVALLSTCNRTETYAFCTRFHPAVDDVRNFLAGQTFCDPDELNEHLYTYYDDAAVAHLFGVAAGVDSMILGEGEILGQVKDAWRAAEVEGTTGASLSRVFRHAIEVGKRARSETGIGRRAASVASAAVALAAESLGTLVGKNVLVVGAGDMGEGMAVALAGSGVREVVVANRTEERAAELAARVGGKPLALSRVKVALQRCDVLLTSTGASDTILERSDIERVMERRDGRRLLIVDVAVPRDVDPGAAQIPGVTILDMDDLKAFVDQSLDHRRREVVKVRSIISEELERYRADHSARKVAPIVAALHARGEAVRVGELERFRAKLDGLDAKTKDALEALTKGIVNKLLHDPTVRLKDAAGSARGELYTDALQALFALPDE